MAWQAGQEIGPYIIEAHLGQGGMATVYKAYHPQLDRSVAIKVMHQNFLDDETFIARFKREAQIVARLSHPHIVPVYDFDEYDGLPYLVMKYVPGITLKQKRRQQTLTLDEILQVMTPVASALTYAHKQGILHRDVKPSNIVLDMEGVPYLTDFGLARLASAGESTMSADMLLGTPHYISPEQARGERELDGRADIYSFGVVLYELMVGQVPFTADTPYAIIHAHIYTPPPQARLVNPEIPDSVADVLERSLAKDPDERYENADDLMIELKEVLVYADLNALNDERESIAAASLAQMRTSDKTPVLPAIQSPNTTGSYRTATIYNAPHHTSRLWPISGCASFLIFTFLSGFILLNASSNLIELSALFAGSSENESVFSALANANNLPPAFTRLGITIENDSFPRLITPTIDIDQTEELLNRFPDMAEAYLVHASAQWRGDRAAAIETLRRGYTVAENDALYLMNAALIAQVNNDGQRAVAFIISALEVADPDTFENIRPFATETLYDAGNSAGVLTALELNRALDDANITDNLTNLNLVAADGALLVLASNFVQRDSIRLAGSVFERIPRNSRLRAEFDLLEAELAVSRDALMEAQRFLDVILEDDMAPDWVEERADNLLDSIDNMEE